MKCNNCLSKDIQFVRKCNDRENEYRCLDCGRTIITTPENENREVEV